MQKSIKSFIRQHGITAVATWIPGRPDGLGEDFAPGSNHYKVKLTRKGHSLTIYWSQGPAISGDPTAEDVLDSLSLDASCGSQSFAEYCSEFGVDEDSRKAEKVWRSCVRLRSKLTKFLDGDLETLFACERL